MADSLPSNRRTSAFERRVARALGPLEGAVLVAASGGADSTATLVAVTRALGPERVTAAHFDHRLRPPAEAARDFETVRDVAQRLGILVAAGRASRRPSDRSEAVAREARYRWLARACQRAGLSCCVTGHTLDDQAETVLMRLVRGTGALGASGMRAESEWPVPVRGARALRVLRPLLGITRGEVEGYLHALGVTSSADSTNETLDYARNRLRHEVMPVLRELNDRAGEHLVSFADAQREDELALTAVARDWVGAHVNLGRGVVTMSRAELRALSPAVAARALREASAHLGIRLERPHLEAILESLEKSGRTVDLP